MALPAAWGTLVDILFVGVSLHVTNLGANGECVSSTRHFWQFVRSLGLQYSSVFLAAVWAQGGSCIASIALSRDIPWPLGGVMIIDGPKTPSAFFFSHSSLDTGNGLVETNFSVNRASQPVVCNAPLSRATFIMNDAHFIYTPMEKKTLHPGLIGGEGLQTAAEDFNMKLDHVMIPGVGCYAAPNPLPLHPRDEEMPPLIGSFMRSHRKFECPASEPDGNQTPATDPNYDLLLANPIGRVLLISTLRHLHSLTCSFYLGIFKSDALRFEYNPRDGVSSALLSFNDATLETLWPIGDASPLGEVQERSEASNSDKKKRHLGHLTWAHLNTGLIWSRRASLRLLSHMKGDINELDFFSSRT